MERIQVKDADHIMKLLDSVGLPRRIAIMHCKAHQLRRTIQDQGNRWADLAAKAAVEKGIEMEGEMLALMQEKRLVLTENPKYDLQDRKLIDTLLAQNQEKGWAVTPSGQRV